jgi:glycosyltransferase involved in cell wall biosynthesis
MAIATKSTSSTHPGDSTRSTVPDFCRDTPPWSSTLRVLWMWHAAVVAEYRKPLPVLASCPRLDLTLLIPRRWPERAGQMVHAESDPIDHAAYPQNGQLSGRYRVISARTLFTGFYYVYIFPSLLYQLLRYRPDIIYCYEEPHTFIAACVLLLRRLFFPRTRVLLYAAQNIKKRYPLPFRFFERYCFRHTDGILACGTRVAQTLRSKGYNGKLHVVGLPTDVRTFVPDGTLRAAGRGSLGIGPGAQVIGYAGKLVEEKGLFTLLRAFAELAPGYSDAHLVLAGGGAIAGELKRTAEQLGLAGRVHMPGVIHNSQLPAFMNALDVFVLPSETRPNWREQFGRVLVEAMACGVPVVGSDSGEIPTVIESAGLTFPEADAEALAAQLACLLGNPGERSRLGREGRERVCRLFSTEQVAAQHYAIYRQLFQHEGS